MQFSEKYLISRDFKPIQPSEKENRAIPTRPITEGSILSGVKVEEIQIAKATRANEYGISRGPRGFFESKISLNIYKNPKIKTIEILMMNKKEVFVDILTNQVM